MPKPVPMDILGPVPLYQVTLRYSEPDPISRKHEVSQLVQLREEADSEPQAAWLVKAKLRLALGKEVRIFSWDVEEDQLACS